MRSESSRESGSSSSVEAARLAPPHPGRMSNSSGRVVAASSIGPRTSRRSRSSKSRSSGSAQCRSSTRTTSTRSATSSSMSETQASCRRSRAASGCRSPARSSPSVRPRISLPASRLRTTSGGSVSRRPKCSFSTSASGQYVMPWPYGRQRPVRRNGSGDCPASQPQNSRIRRVLPTPGSPTTVTRCGPALRRPRYAVCKCSSSASRPMKTRRRPPTPRGRMSDTARTTSRQEMPAGFPFACTVVGSPNSNAPRAATTVRSPASTCPGGAASSSRAATLTASPVTKELPSRGRPTTTSPVLTPIRRANSPSKSSLSRFCIERAACNARSASSS